MFSIEDLFAFGLGCDIAGGYLVARGLLAPVPILNRRATTFWKFNATTFKAQAEDRIAGQFGLAALTVGFAAQAAGYVAVAGGVRVPTGGLDHATVAVLATAVPIVGVLAAARLLRPGLLRRLCVQAAHHPLDEGPRSELPFGEQLWFLGDALGHPRLDQESNADYARRVWSVERIANDEASAPSDIRLGA